MGADAGNAHGPEYRSLFAFAGGQAFSSEKEALTLFCIFPNPIVTSWTSQYVKTGGFN
jgi:hypothetical protein